MSKILEVLTTEQLNTLAEESGYTDVDIVKSEYVKKRISDYYVYNCHLNCDIQRKEYTAHVYVKIEFDNIVLEF